MRAATPAAVPRRAGRRAAAGATHPRRGRWYRRPRPPAATARELRFAWLLDATRAPPAELQESLPGRLPLAQQVLQQLARGLEDPCRAAPAADRARERLVDHHVARLVLDVLERAV